jgi:hypothetical protein
MADYDPDTFDDEFGGKEDYGIADPVEAYDEYDELEDYDDELEDDWDNGPKMSDDIDFGESEGDDDWDDDEDFGDFDDDDFVDDFDDI